MKTGISVELLAHYAGRAWTLARLWKLTTRTGAVYAFTDHDRALTFDSVAYVPTSAFDMAAISTKAALNVDNSEMQGLLDALGITAEDIEAGAWDGATFELLEVNWRDLTMGANILRTGEVGEVKREGLTYRFELRGLMQALQNNVGRLVLPACDADLGDARCGVDLEALRVTSAVTAVASRRAFTAAGLMQAAGYFTFGVVTFTSGLNEGRSMEVRLHEAAGVFTLQLPLPYALTVADTFTVVPGCDKRHELVDGVWLGDCKNKFDNVINFRGSPFVPGADKVALFGGQ
ncbi:MAG: DUF2163 domain-containing protein [Pseudomonadota bacterium]